MLWLKPIHISKGAPGNEFDFRIWQYFKLKEIEYNAIYIVTFSL